MCVCVCDCILSVSNADNAARQKGRVTTPVGTHARFGLCATLPSVQTQARQHMAHQPCARARGSTEMPHQNKDWEE